MAGFLGRVCGVTKCSPVGHEQQCKPNAEGKFTCTMLRRSLLSLRSSNRSTLPPVKHFDALHPHPDKSQPAKMAVLPHAADFLRVPINPSLLIWLFYRMPQIFFVSR